jgi:death-on-curing protein
MVIGNTTHRELATAALGREIGYDFLSVSQVTHIHNELVRIYGGRPGVRADGPQLLESALRRPIQAACLDETLDIVALASMSCEAIVKDRPFLDGNERTGLWVLYAMMESNQYDFDPEPAEVMQALRGLSGSTLTREEFVTWLRANAFQMDENARTSPRMRGG